MQVHTGQRQQPNTDFKKLHGLNNFKALVACESVETRAKTKAGWFIYL